MNHVHKIVLNRDVMETMEHVMVVLMDITRNSVTYHVQRTVMGVSVICGRGLVQTAVLMVGMEHGVTLVSFLWMNVVSNEIATFTS